MRIARFDQVVSCYLASGGYDLMVVVEGGDLRAGERTYQQIAQVSGRAGRGAKPGKVLIQTRAPKSPVIAALAAGDRDAFYAAETQGRRDANAPPFGRWAAIILSSEDEKEAREAAVRAKRWPSVASLSGEGPLPSSRTQSTAKTGFASALRSTPAPMVTGATPCLSALLSRFFAASASDNSSASTITGSSPISNRSSAAGESSA